MPVIFDPEVASFSSDALPPMAEYTLTPRNLERGLEHRLKASLEGILPPDTPWNFMPSDHPDHGDFSSAVAFSLAKIWKKSPMAIAQQLCADLSKYDFIEGAEALAGYVNIRVQKSLWEEELRYILRAGTTYGHQQWGQGAGVNVEYVSANPTGPLHAAHARGAVFGDVVANLLHAVGYKVTREYYINDAGQQVLRLAETVLCHCKALERGETAVIPEGLYPGAYGQDIGRAFLEAYPDTWQDQSLETIATFGVREMMGDIQEVLQNLGVFHTVFTSEKALQRAGLLEKMEDLLRKKDLVYFGLLPQPVGREDPHWVPTPLKLFRSSAFGDDQDRVLQRKEGDWTYFANDIAYHWDKARRKTEVMIDVWGADHASHVQRMHGAVEAVSGKNLEVLLFQMVHFLHNGVALKMSKRSGNFVLLREVLEMIDPDVLRFMILTKKADTHLELDILKMQEQSNANPVFYVQYAHARCCSVLRAAKKELSEQACTPEALAEVPFDPTMDWTLVKLLADWPRQVSEAALHREPHRLPNYLHRVAHALHGLWQRGNQDPSMKLISDDGDKTRSSMALIQATALVMASGLRLLGIAPKEELR